MVDKVASNIHSNFDGRCGPYDRLPCGFKKRSAAIAKTSNTLLVIIPCPRDQ
ncbi:hypothetical protein ACE04B_16045 [Rhizobium phaseoli]